MADVLLRELSNTDIDWLSATGHQEQVAAGTVLLRPCQESEFLYLLLDGTLSLRVPEAGSPTGDRELLHLTSGDIVGEAPLLNTRLLASIKVMEPSLVLTIPRQQLLLKLQQDACFGAHFYRALGLMLAERLRQLLKRMGQIPVMGERQVKEALYLFAELRDSDVDWLVATGQLQPLAPGDLLLQAGRPVDGIFMILDGLLSALVFEGDVNPFTLCFECPRENASRAKPVATLTQGELAGAVAFLDFRPLPMTIEAVNESLVLAVSRSQLAPKLQQDTSFASRFYRILAIQLANNLQNAMDQAGCSQQTYCREQGLQEKLEYDDEMDIEALEQISRGANRLSWMLKRLGVM